MKRRLLLFGLAVLLCVAAIVLWHYRARLFPDRSTSHLYVLYEHRPGIEADFIRNMRIDDTTAVDVTVLHAADSAAWARLCDDFELPPATDLEKACADQGRDVTRLVRYRGDIDTAAMPPVVAASLARRTVSIFHVASAGEKHAILYYNFDKSQKNITK